MERKEAKKVTKIEGEIFPSKSSQANKKSQTQKKSNEDEISLLDMLNEIDKESKPKKKPYIFFKEQSIAIPIWSVLSVEKEECVNTNPCRVVPNWKYAIIINKGIESGKGSLFGEIRVEFENCVHRDKSFDRLIEALKKYNYDFVEI